MASQFTSEQNQHVLCYARKPGPYVPGTDNQEPSPVADPWTETYFRIKKSLLALRERSLIVGLCERVFVDRVLCDECFTIRGIDTGAEIGGIPVPPGSTISGTVEVGVLRCTPQVDLIDNRIRVELVFMIQQELTIITPEQTSIPLEYAFRVTRTVTFEHCRPCELQAICADVLEDLECRVLHVQGKNRITLNPSNPPTATNASFDGNLCIKIKLKLVQQKQLTVALCSPRKRTVFRISK
ncbi:MAG TPA: hypothetical protein DDW87_14610 [Firmicutes bacterium]|nr:hypothetical protein [Bacillota bacterium]